MNNYHIRKDASDLIAELGTAPFQLAIALQRLWKKGYRDKDAQRAINACRTVLKLPDDRYSADLEYGGWEDGPRFVPRFCGERIRNPDGRQVPACQTRDGAIAYCHEHAAGR